MQEDQERKCEEEKRHHEAERVADETGRSAAEVRGAPRSQAPSPPSQAPSQGPASPGGDGSAVTTTLLARQMSFASRQHSAQAQQASHNQPLRAYGMPAPQNQPQPPVPRASYGPTRPPGSDRPCNRRPPPGSGTIAVAVSPNLAESDRKMDDEGESMFTDAKDIAVTATDKESKKIVDVASLRHQQWDNKFRQKPSFSRNNTLNTHKHKRKQKHR